MASTQYAAFLHLPSAALRLPGGAGAGTVPATLPHRLAVAGYEDERPSAAPEAFDVAKRYIEDHEHWEAEQVSKRADREERQEAMRKKTGGGTSAPSQAAAAGTSSEEEKVKSVIEATGLSAERARYYLNLNDWRVDKAVLNATEIGAPVAPSQREADTYNGPAGVAPDVARAFLVALREEYVDRKHCAVGQFFSKHRGTETMLERYENECRRSRTPQNYIKELEETWRFQASGSANEAMFEFRLPGGKVETQGFALNRSGFDVYQKTYDLLTNKDQGFSITISGPRDYSNVPRGTERLNQKPLGAETWSITLKEIGLVAATYEVVVTHDD